MKIERAYLGDALRRLRGRSRSDVTRHLAYRTAGETVRPGTYECTLCGRAVDISRPGPLPLCAACDGCEFAGLASPAELEAADPLSPTRQSESDQQAA